MTETLWRQVTEPDADTEVLPDLTVVICCYNAAAVLPSQLAALAGQDYPGRWEVLVVDNGSSDGTADVAREWAHRFPSLRVVDASERPGKPFAVNKAVQLATGWALVMLDSDDQVSPGFLTAMGEALAMHDVVAARLDPFQINDRDVVRRRRPLQDTHLETFLRYRAGVIGAGLGLRRSAFDAVGGFDEEMLRIQDIDLTWRLQRAGYAPVFVPDAVVHYRYRAGLQATFKQELAYATYEVLLYRKHRGHGLPRRRVRTTVRAWLSLLLEVPTIGTRSGRARLVTKLGSALGRLRGSWRHRTLYL